MFTTAGGGFRFEKITRTMKPPISRRRMIKGIAQSHQGIEIGGIVPAPRLIVSFWQKAPMSVIPGGQSPQQTGPAPV